MCWIWWPRVGLQLSTNMDPNVPILGDVIMWACVSVLSVLGRYKGDAIAEEWKVAEETQFAGILYYNWPINSLRHRAYFKKVFGAMQEWEPRDRSKHLRGN
jgi:hypothetical protein